MLLAVSFAIGCALSIPVAATTARADVGVGLHVGGPGAGAHIGIGGRHYRHRYCSAYAWHHHHRYCRRWRW